mmetsp:Transcript_44410/g.114866  ORF Transcript_44410/g.114866 Transcript_44410/m.114866 type:complete len:292 (+) Transcript_44410:135-1010(+)
MTASKIHEGRHQRPHEALQRPDEITDEESAGDHHVEQVDGDTRLERDALHRREAGVDRLVHELQRVGAALREEHDGHVEQEVHETEDGKHLEEQQRLAVAPGEADPGAHARVHKAHDPVRRHYEGTQERVHNARGDGPSLENVIDRIPRQGHEHHGGHRHEAHYDDTHCERQADIDLPPLHALVVPDDVRRLAHDVADHQLVHRSCVTDPPQRPDLLRQPPRGLLVRQDRRLRLRGTLAPDLTLELPLASLEVEVVREDREDAASVLHAAAMLEPRAHLGLLLLREAAAVS